MLKLNNKLQKFIMKETRKYNLLNPMIKKNLKKSFIMEFSLKARWLIKSKHCDVESVKPTSH